MRSRGLDPAELVSGLELQLADVEHPRRRIPWRDFVVFVERAEKTLGSATLEELAANATLDYVPRPVRRMLPRLRDSRPLFSFAARWWGPWVFRGTRGQCEVLPDGRIREIVRILPDYAPCPEFLAGIRGTLRAMPRLLGQPDALVTIAQDGREGEYLITPPPRRATARTPVGEQRGAAEPHPDPIRELASLLTRGEGGESLQQDIVRLVHEHRGVSGVRVTQYVEGGPGRVTAAGATAGAAGVVLPLRIGPREIGRLEIWHSGADSVAPLRELTPWIAFALEYTRSKALVSQLVDLLVEDVRDWERFEHQLEQLATRRVGDASPRDESAEWPTEDRETIDLSEFIYGMASRLHELTRDEVQLELRCADDLPPAVGDRRQLESVVVAVAEILADMGSEEIRLEARAVDAGAGLASGTGEVVVYGRGDELTPLSRGWLRAALQSSETGQAIADADVDVEPDGTVGVRLRLPLRTTAAREQLH